MNKTGPTKLALREGHDVIDTPFIGNSSQYNQLQIRTSEYTGTTNDPVLEVTYTLPTPTNTITYTYDAAGQRVKVVSGGVTTVYPSASYNTDGTTAQKHIMASGVVVATIKGSGAGATAYYVATDHLTGSSVVTNSTGVQQELMDYFPFGSIRLDEKAGTFSEQRKFTGQEYDADTGLSYMNARYYNGTIGRFTSQDPLAIEALQTTDPKKFVQIISNPQNWNTYSYALNNPLVASDPSGLLTVVELGTWGEVAKFQDSQVYKDLANAFHEAPYIFGKDIGQNGVNDNRWSRSNAAENLADFINSYPFHDGEKLNIYAHSHGANVVFEATHSINHNVDNLIAVEAPARSDYQPDLSKVSNFINVHSNRDWVQTVAGGQLSATSILGFILTGPLGYNYGKWLGLGEFGPSGRYQQGSTYEVDVSDMAARGHLKSHTDTFRNSSIFQQRIVPLLKK